MNPIFPVKKKGQHIDAAKDMANEYRRTLKECKEALADRDAKEYSIRLSQMKSFLDISFVDPDGDQAHVKTYLTWFEIHRPFGILTINGWKETT